MPRLRYTAAAKDDIDSIAEYITSESGSRAVAERLTRELRQKCRELAAAPIIVGCARPELRSDLRGHPHKAYVIFFRYVGDFLEVVDILEGHRDIDAFFGREATQRLRAMGCPQLELARHRGILPHGAAAVYLCERTARPQVEAS